MTTTDAAAHPARTGDQEQPGTTEDEIRRLRWRIDTVDRRIAELLVRRKGLALALGRSKDRSGLPLMDPAREAAVVRHAARRARGAGLDEERVRQIYWSIIELSREAQRISDEDDPGAGGPWPSS